MLIRLTFLLMLIAAPAAAQGATPTYVIYPTQAACLARSATQARAMDATGNTQYWWDCIGPLTAGAVDGQAIAAGSYAMTVQATGPFGATTTNTIETSATGLTETEQDQLIAAGDLAPLLPSN